MSVGFAAPRLVKNGALLTPAGIVKGSILFKNGKIAALGAQADLAADAAAGAAQVDGAQADAADADEAQAQLGGSQLEVIDAAGGLVSAGFQDAHVHPIQAGLNMIRCDLAALNTREQYLNAVAQYNAAHPDLDWVQGGGWSMEAFGTAGPTAAMLDPVIADRPVFLNNRDGHGVWVNSLALKLAGITRDTPDPADGRIERDDTGAPTGTLHEGAVNLVARLLPAPTAEEMRTALLTAQKQLFGWGVTAWQDAIIGRMDVVPDAFEVYRTAAAQSELKADVVGALWWDRNRGLEQIEELVRRRSLASAGTFRCTSVKIMLDGVIENFTALMNAPYLDSTGALTDNVGKSFVPAEVLAEAVNRLDELGFQIHFHALGDGAVRLGLDLLEQARERNGVRDSRHHLAHIQVVDPADVPRFAKLQVAANIQSYWAVHEEQMDVLTVPFLGVVRSRQQFPFASIAAAGGVLAGGSDWPVTTANPLEIIHTAVNRAHSARDAHGAEDAQITQGAHAARGAGNSVPRPMIGEEALNLKQAWLAHTWGAAFVNHLEHRTGSLEAGKDADVVVLNMNPFDEPVANIADAQVMHTFKAGEPVFRRA